MVKGWLEGVKCESQWQKLYADTKEMLEVAIWQLTEYVQTFVQYRAGVRWRLELVVT